MAAPAVTYTFVNGPTHVIDADEVNQNFADLVGVIGAGTGDISVDTVNANSAVIGVLTVNGSPISASSINSAAVSAINAYDYTTIVRNEMSYAAGTFSCTASGISDGAGNVRTFTASYVKIGALVNLFLPDHDGPTDGYNPGSPTPMPWYVLNGLPAEITPAATMTVDMPLGVYENSALVFNKNVAGIIGYSALSSIFVDANGGFFGGGAGTKGYPKNICVVYSI